MSCGDPGRGPLPRSTSVSTRRLAGVEASAKSRHSAQSAVAVCWKTHTSAAIRPERRRPARRHLGWEVGVVVENLTPPTSPELEAARPPHRAAKGTGRGVEGTPSCARPDSPRRGCGRVSPAPAGRSRRSARRRRPARTGFPPARSRRRHSGRPRQATSRRSRRLALRQLQRPVSSAHTILAPARQKRSKAAYSSPPRRMLEVVGSTLVSRAASAPSSRKSHRSRRPDDEHSPSSRSAGADLVHLER